jgi:uncharacterized integral membrane protein
MTERAARRWAKRRVHGRFWYAFRTGLLFAVLMIALRIWGSDSIPWAVLAGATAAGAIVSFLLAWIHWDYKELQFSLFQQSQACSESISRA